MKKFFYSIIFLISLFFLFSPKSVLAGCDQAIYSKWDTYIPGPGGVCGATEGKPDCLNSDNMCWQYITKKEDTSCQTGYRSIFDPINLDAFDEFFIMECSSLSSSMYPRVCCKTAFAKGCSKTNTLTVTDPFNPGYCQKYLAAMADPLTNKNSCTLPAHYNPSEPMGYQCTSASGNRTLPPAGGGSGVPLTSPGGWFGRINTGGAVSPGGGLDFFSNKLVPFLINVGLVIITILSLFFMLLAGIFWIAAGGDKEALAKAKGTLTYAIVGLSVAFSVFIILKIIGNFFNVKFL